MRLFIRKSYIKTFFKNSEFENDVKDVFDEKEMKMFFYGNVDSRSKVELFNLKQLNINDANYDFLLKGVAFTLLGYLIERLSLKMPNSRVYREKDLESVMFSQQYLLSNLLIPFPGIEILAKMANMSLTKFKNLYGDIFGITPGAFFKNEKLLLAKELLESGNFKLISDVACELGYNKTTYFSTVYKEYFGVLPSLVMNNSQGN